jgi:hypothetical protein
MDAGTIVIFLPAKDKFIVAADSRGLKIRGNEPPDDHKCKIAVFHDQFVFANSGSIAYERTLDNDPVKEWSNSIEAQIAIGNHKSDKGDAQTVIEHVATAWAESLRSKWQFLYSQNKELVLKAAKPPSYVLTSGIFATARQGNIGFAVRELTLDGAQVRIIQSKCGPDHYCGAGQTDVFLEFVRQSSPRAVAEFKSWAESSVAESKRRSIDLRTLYAIRLAELTIAYDSTGTVGGRVDAIEIEQDGTVRWAQVKPCCA